MSPRSTGPQAHHGPRTRAWFKVAHQTFVLHMALGNNRSSRHQLNPSCCRVTDPDMPLCSIHGPGNARTPGDSTGNSHQYVSDDSMALRCPHGSRFWPRSQMSMWPLMAACATDINTDPGCDQNTDLDMFLGISLGKDVTMFLGGYVGHKNQHGPHRSMALGGSLDSIIMAVIDGLRSHRYQHRP